MVSGRGPKSVWVLQEILVPTTLLKVRGSRYISLASRRLSQEAFPRFESLKTPTLRRHAGLRCLGSWRCRASAGIGMRSDRHDIWSWAQRCLAIKRSCFRACACTHAAVGSRAALSASHAQSSIPRLPQARHRLPAAAPVAASASPAVVLS